MRVEKEQRGRIQQGPPGCSGGQDHVCQGFPSCCRTRNKAYYIQGWNSNGQGPPFDRKSIYPLDTVHLVITGERTSISARFIKTLLWMIGV